MPDSIQDRLKNQPPYDSDVIPPKEEVEKPVTEEVVEETPKEVPQEAPQEPSKTEEVIKEVIEDVQKVKKEVEKVEKTKERTAEQFEKLKESNRTLKEERDIAKRKNVLDSLIPEPRPIPQVEPTTFPESPVTNVVPDRSNFPNLTKQDIKNTFEGLVDEQGYVDTGLLVNTLTDLQNKNKEAEERAKKAEQQTQQVARNFDDFQRKELMRKVHMKYPKLDPDNEEFDERLWEGVRNEVIGQWTSGHQEDVMAAATKWSDILYGKEEEVKKADKIKLQEAEQAKKDINALGVKQTSQRNDSDEEYLIRATQKGEKGALAERLRRAGQ